VSIETIRLSERQKNQLITIKRRTGIQHWNVLSRWALCLSLAEPGDPPDENIISDSNVEMTWKTFAGRHTTLYLALLRTRAKRSLNDSSQAAVEQCLKLHLNRGISYLAGKTNPLSKVCAD